MRYHCPKCNHILRKREPRKDWSRQFEPYFWCDNCKSEYPIDEHGKPEQIAAGLLREDG